MLAFTPDQVCIVARDPDQPLGLTSFRTATRDALVPHTSFTELKMAIKPHCVSSDLSP
jgi:hypothetical protein